MADLIAPQVLKGFRDSLPQHEIPKKALMARLEKVFESFGFVPIDTPALEYTEVLLGKGGGETEKQMFRFEDNGGRDVALRFDLTVPFARFMAANSSQLALPFKRFHMAKVWRGEKPQKGRYREFYQCDCDIVGVDSASADFEILFIMSQAMTTLGAGGATIHVNHRGIFNRFLETIGIREHSVEILRTVDKLAKIGPHEVLGQLSELVAAEKARQVLEYVSAKGSFTEVLAKLENLAGGPADDTKRMSDLWNLMEGVGIQAKFVFDPSITRGLDYYTGVVFETFLQALPDIGSVCSGGRYNDLANLYTKEKLPGIGGSVGLDRLLAALEELGTFKSSAGTTQVLILQQDPKLAPTYHFLARAFRDRGIVAEVYLDERKIPVQYKYAEAKGIPFVVTLAQDTVAGTTNPFFQLKNIATGETRQSQDLDAALRWITES